MKALEAPGNSVDPRTRARWRAWLAKNHEHGEGVWLVLGKKSAKTRRLTYDEAVEEALCFGWIDSRSRSLDDERTMVWMSPRSVKSNWSKSNKDRVERMVAAGRMAAAGLALVEAAKKSGTWSALDKVDALLLPKDLAAALRAAKGYQNFIAFPPGSRRNVLAWIESAKKPQTRAKRIAETARLAAMNIRVHDFITMARTRKG
jgi:uncharacterized protein YdeI (YjbR/CyaY-like superfamily)